MAASVFFPLYILLAYSFFDGLGQQYAFLILPTLLRDHNQGLFLVDLTYSLGNGYINVTTNCLWLETQFSTSLRGSGTGVLGTDIVFELDAADWSKYATFHNQVADALQTRFVPAVSLHTFTHLNATASPPRVLANSTVVDYATQYFSLTLQRSEQVLVLLQGLLGAQAIGNEAVVAVAEDLFIENKIAMYGFDRQVAIPGLFVCKPGSESDEDDDDDSRKRSGGTITRKVVGPAGLGCYLDFPSSATATQVKATIGSAFRVYAPQVKVTYYGGTTLSSASRVYWNI